MVLVSCDRCGVVFNYEKINTVVGKATIGQFKSLPQVGEFYCPVDKTVEWYREVIND